jgi:hypothetical protein
VGRAEPVGGLQRLVEDPLEPGYVRADDALRLLEPRGSASAWMAASISASE